MSNVQALITVTNAADAKEVKLVEKVNTLIGKTTEATVALDKYLQERAAEAARLNIEVGTEGSFVFGRAATAKELTGKVIAVVELEGGAKLLKVMAGEGIEMKIYDVAPSKFDPKGEQAEQGVGTPDPIQDAAVSQAVVAESPETATGVVDLPFDVNSILGGATEADAAVAGL
ncbi:hypothetical protein Andromeda_12 [Pseudomonas phage Andromeda]|uniref:Uncharacterized protein n=1 Tax=Pseudomonas phage Andromeda TaxID=1873949 RepID=A0A1B1SEG9_9CAUD|nr:hypothetical protein BI052_gp12 [Pseudomonas phage Andromeda]ANU79087.1 hypothetical protein Andromeda_12 [Pseudomonas phage Andromeda]